MEIFSSWALFIMIMLLIAALFTSYMLQQKKVEAVHETVISIFAGKEASYFKPSLSNSPRYDRRPHPQNQQWNLNSKPGHIQRPDILQPPPSTHHSSIRVRIASGKLFSEHWLHLDFCVRWNVHICDCAGFNIMGVYSDPY